MIVLDTNVVSELMRAGSADKAVVSWARHLTERPWTTAITRAEVMVGVARLAPGRRRQDLAALARRAFGQLQGVLPFDDAAAEVCALVVSERQRLGRPIAWADAFVPAIALSHGAALATRNLKDFGDLGSTS